MISSADPDIRAKEIPWSRPTTLGALLDWGTAQLEPVDDGAQNDAALLLGATLNVARTTILAFPERRVDPLYSRRYRDAVDRRRAGEPAAYIVGHRDFYSIDLEVNSDVLVPRPESELIVDVVLSRTAADQAISVLDLGTGSGALALAIKHERPAARVAGADSSPGALRAAAANGRRLGLEVRWLESDWFSGVSGERFDIVVCNPPYVRSDDPHMPVLCYEPQAALDGGADGLVSIRQVLSFVRSYMEPNGCLVMEHGFDQAAEVAELAACAGLEVVRAEKDLAGHVRVAVIEARA